MTTLDLTRYTQVLTAVATTGKVDTFSTLDVYSAVTAGLVTYQRETQCYRTTLPGKRLLAQLRQPSRIVQ